MNPPPIEVLLASAPVNTTTTLYASILFNNNWVKVKKAQEILLAYVWVYSKSCYGKRIVGSHSLLSQVSINKSVNKGLNRENLFSKHESGV
jgi:hypothetical protein